MQRQEDKEWFSRQKRRAEILLPDRKTEEAKNEGRRGLLSKRIQISIIEKNEGTLDYPAPQRAVEALWVRVEGASWGDGRFCVYTMM